MSFWRLYYHVIWATKGREPWLCGEVDRRIRSIRVPRKGRYLKRIIRAHAAHHQKSTRHKGVSFGFLWALATTPTPDALGSTERALAGSTSPVSSPCEGEDAEPAAAHVAPAEIPLRGRTRNWPQRTPP